MSSIIQWAVVTFSLCVIPDISFAQANADEIKGAIILQICENVEWPEEKHDEFVIGFFSDNQEVYKALKSIEGTVKVQKKHLKLVQGNSLNELIYCNAIYLNKFNSDNIGQFFEQARKNNILLITENYNDPFNVHVNLIEEGTRIAFNVNMANLTLANLAVKPNILLNGGSVVDIKTAFEEFDNKLKESRDKLHESEEQLKQKEDMLQLKDNQIADKEIVAKYYAFKIDSLSRETEKQSELADRQNKELKKKELEIEIKNANLSSIYWDINKKQEELDQLKSNISKSQEEANQLKNRIDKQNEILTEKDKHIDTQHRLILLFISMLSGFILAAFAISRLFFIKRKLSIKLQGANEELQNAIEELNTKNEIINDRNTELSTALKNLKETQTQLIQAEKMASLGVLTAGVAHEINNPLNYILGGYHILYDYVEQNNLSENSSIKLALKGINEGVERANNIVKGLDAFSYSDKGYDELCDINNIVENCLLVVSHNLNDNINIIKKFGKNLPIIHGKSAKLHQAILNIITNATQALEDSGVINISTQLKNDTVILIVEDNGHGISKENLGRVADPFFTTKQPGEGTGLGLSIAYNIIMEHCGGIDIKSEPGKSTTVTISLPV